MSCKLVHV